jgi:hypothetical protein
MMPWRQRQINYELEARGLPVLTLDEYLLLMSKEDWSVQTCTNMIVQIRRLKREKKDANI